MKYRLNRKNASGTYDTIHYETSSNIVLRPSGRTVEQDLEAYLPRTQSTDDVPQSLTFGLLQVANSKVFARVGNGSTVDLTQDTNTVYAHPTTQQCSSVNVSNATGILPVTRGGTGATSLDGLKSNLGISGISPSKPTATSVGSTFTMSNIEWIVVHNTGSIVYACSRYILGYDYFGYDNTYSSSQMLLLCRMLEASIGLTGSSWAVNTTVNGATSKLFIPSYDQYNGGFSYFSSDTNRICTTAGGGSCPYWTSTADSGSSVWYVLTDGILDNGNPGSGTYGFRPCLGIQQ